MRTAYALIGVGFALLFLATFLLTTYLKGGPSEGGEGKSPLLQNSTHDTMLTLTSPAFVEGGSIPQKYTCDGDGVNPEIQITDAPTGTKSLVLSVDDPDIPEFVKEKMSIDVFDHWVLFNISPETTRIPENSVPQGARSGRNSTGGNTYVGPCPPDGEHRYFFKLYALSHVLELKEGATKEEVARAMEGKILATSTLLGRYARLSE
jgi:Raf kinase inhibitor-like YbhB/YbcL family protein